MLNQTSHLSDNSPALTGAQNKLEPPFFYRLRTRMIILFTAISILTGLILSAGLYIRVRNNIESSTRQHMVELVSIASLLVNADVEARLSDSSQESSEDYLSIQRTLQRIRNFSTDIRYVYTMRYVNSQQIFIVDAETDPNLASHLGDVYNEVLPSSMTMMMSANKPYVEPELTTDDWGTWLTSCAPLFLANGVRGDFLCMDLAASNMVAQQRQTLWIAFAIIATLIPFSAGFGWWIGDRLTSPLATIIAGVERIKNGELTHRLNVPSQDETATLAQSLNQMVNDLEKKYSAQNEKVAMLSHELERRTTYLTAAVEINRTTSSNLDVDHMSQHAVDIIQNNFRSDYTGLFLLSDDGKWAELQAGTGERGEAMMKRHHRIALAKGMIGWCITNGQARVAQNVAQDVVRLEIPELPDIRSEAAIPLRTRGRIIGAITVQSKQENQFDEIAVDSLQIIADQLAIAIDNTRLRVESREAISTHQLATKDQGQFDPMKLFKGRPYIGYYANIESTSLIDEKSPAQELSRLNAQNVLHLPIRVRGQVLGTIHARKNETEGMWNPEETALLTALTDQLSLALDNARLYQDTQRSAEREHIISDITAKVRASTNVNVILQTAITELAEALKISKATIQLGAEDQTGSTDHRSNGGEANG